jgi:hypothetical protein
VCRSSPWKSHDEVKWKKTQPMNMKRRWWYVLKLCI